MKKKERKVFNDYIHENIGAVECRWDKEYVCWCDTDDINDDNDNNDDDDGDDDENNGNDEDLT